VDKGVMIPEEFLNGPLWNNDKPYSEAQAYIQFMVWANQMGGVTKFINGNMITLKPGEFIMSQRKIAESLNWTQSTVNRFLKKLVTLNQCCINNESRMTRISLLIKEPEPESIMNQEPKKEDTLFDNFIGGRTNSTNSSNNYNIIYNNTSTNNNTIPNNNILSKDDKKHSTIKVGRGKSVKYVAKPKDLQMVKDYFKEKGLEESEAVRFYSHYESVGWFRGKTKIKKWRMAVSTWQKNMWEKPAEKKKRITSEYKLTPSGQYLVYCTNSKCKEYGSSCFAKNEWDIQKGCYHCSSDVTPKNPKPSKPINKELYEQKKEPQEYQKGPKEPSTGSRTPTGDSEHISDIFSGMFQSGPRGS
tara:strand:- start:767 stop:1840 length:1074 start_codon:yes stop_codon:yes gene_type:complete